MSINHSIGLKKAWITRRKNGNSTAWNKGKKGLQISHKKGVRNISMSIRQTGSNNPNWKGGVSKENELFRKTINYKNWRKHVFTRDDYTCQACGQKGGQLHADHELPFADFPDLRLEVLNGRTLCVGCHKNTDSYGNRISPFVIPQKYLQELV